MLLSKNAPQLEQELRRYSRESTKWRIETTDSVAAVISTYENLPPDLIVLDPIALDGDLNTLLEHAKRNWPRTFFSLLSDQPKESFKSTAERFGNFPIIEPKDAKSVSQAIEKEMVGLVNGTLRGLMISSFLQMMEWEKKSVSVHVSVGKKWGRLHLYEGKFVSAYVHPKKLTDEQAALEILMWDNISIAVERSYHNHNNKTLIPLSNLLMDAMIKKDEAALDEPALSDEDFFLDDDLEMVDTEDAAEQTNFRQHDQSTPSIAASGPPQSSIFSANTFVAPSTSITEYEDALTVSEEVDDDEMGLYIIQNSVSVPSRRIEKKLLSKPNSRDILVGDILSIDGAVAAALVDYSNGMTLDMVGTSINLELAGAVMTEVVRAQERSMTMLEISGQIEDMMVTMEHQYHLLYVLPSTTLFLYVVLRKEQANLAMARYKLKAAAGELRL